MDQRGFAAREVHRRVLDMGHTTDFGESIHVIDIGFIDEERGIRGQDELRSDFCADFLHHPRKASLHLWMEMDFRLIDDQESSLEIISIDRQDDQQQ